MHPRRLKIPPEFKKEEHSWERVKQDVEKIANKILEEYKPEVVIVIAEGGWIPGSLLRNFIEVEYYSIGCDNYDRSHKKLKEFFVYQNIEESKIKDKRVLIFDEVCLSGETLNEVVKIIKKMNPKELKTAILDMHTTTKFKPDFIANRIENTWVMYPWRFYT